MPEDNLDRLLSTMDPRLASGRFYFASIDESQLMALASYLDYIVSIFREAEGMSLVFHEDIREPVSEMAQSPVQGPFAMISIGVNSDLLAVGFLARLCRALAEQEISSNAFSAYQHDHIFVPWGRKDDALSALQALSNRSRGKDGS